MNTLAPPTGDQPTIRLSAACLKSDPSRLDAKRHRLEISFFQVPADTLPNGLPRPGYIACVCSFRLGRDFCGRARVEKTQDGPYLAVETSAWDTLLGQTVTMPYENPMLAALYREIGRRFILERARQHGREARN